MEGMHGARCVGRGLESSRCASLPDLQVFTHLEALQSPCLSLGFHGSFITKADGLHPWPLEIGLNLWPYPLPRGPGVRLKVPTL